MAFSVLDVGYKGFRFIKLFEDYSDDVDVGLFVMTAEVVYLSDFSFLKALEDAVAVILDIEPVTNIEAFAVNRKGLVMQGVVDH